MAYPYLGNPHPGSAPWFPELEEQRLVAALDAARSEMGLFAALAAVQAPRVLDAIAIGRELAVVKQIDPGDLSLKSFSASLLERLMQLNLISFAPARRALVRIAEGTKP